MVNYFIIDSAIVRVSKERMRPRGERSEIVAAPYYRFAKYQLDVDGNPEVVEDTVAKDAYEAKKATHEGLKAQMKNVNDAIDGLSSLAELKVFLKKLVRVINREINNDNDS